MLCTIRDFNKALHIRPNDTVMLLNNVFNDELEEDVDVDINNAKVIVHLSSYHTINSLDHHDKISNILRITSREIRKTPQQMFLFASKILRKIHTILQQNSVFKSNLIGHICMQDGLRDILGTFFSQDKGKINK